MQEGPDITRIAAMIGDPTRANLLTCLMSGLAMTMGELAEEVGITPQTATSHCQKLRDAGLISQVKQGRHIYCRLKGPEAARLIEGLMGLAESQGHVRTRFGPKDPALRYARVCYDHLAGTIGVQLFEKFRDHGLISLGDDGIDLTEKGYADFTKIGMDLSPLSGRKRVICRECLDWSERRMHLSGHMGALFLSFILAQDWGRRHQGSRALQITPKGQKMFRINFDIQCDAQTLSCTDNMLTA